MTQRYTPVPAYPPLPPDPVAEKGLASERIDGAGSVLPLARHAYQFVADRVISGAPLEALFLYDANPVYDAPGGRRFIEAFNKIPLVVSFSSFMDETAQYADLVLPEPTFLERYQDDHIEGLGYPGVALRQPVIPPRFDTMNTADFLLRVARVMGNPVASAFPWSTYEELLKFRLKDAGTDWATLAELGVWMIPGYRFAWRGSEKWIDEVVGRDRLKSPRDGRFDFYSREMAAFVQAMSPDQKLKFEKSLQQDSLGLPQYLLTSYAGEEKEYPFMLNVITLMSLGPHSAAANMPSLQEISGMTVGETWDSWLEMNPETAGSLGLQDKSLVWVESPFGRAKTKLRTVKGLRPDVVNLPYNQGHGPRGQRPGSAQPGNRAAQRAGCFYKYAGQSLPGIGGRYDTLVYGDRPR
jgi:anaerobic selenocysteine-containing dehydrogenase